MIRYSAIKAGPADTGIFLCDVQIAIDEALQPHGLEFHYDKKEEVFVLSDTSKKTDSVVSKILQEAPIFRHWKNVQLGPRNAEGNLTVKGMGSLKREYQKMERLTEKMWFYARLGKI